jgi:hypothetical protein
MNIYIDRRKDGKITVEADGKKTVFDDRTEAEAFARKKRGRTFALMLSTLEPLEEEPAPRKRVPLDPQDRVTITVEPVVYEGPKKSAFASYRVVWGWRGETRAIAVFVADPATKESDENALAHARQFAKETLAQIEWEAS